MHRILSLTVAAFILAAGGLAAAQQAPAWQDLEYLAGDPPDPLADRAQWEDHSVCVLDSALSPARLIRMKTPTIRFFGGLSAYGAEGPSFIVVNTAQGPRAFGPGQPINGAQMTSSWIVASFQSAKGWEQFDAPWMLSLQRRPAQVLLTAEGLVIRFAGMDTGYIYSMPLYGYEKLPQQGNDFRARHQLPPAPARPWEWRQGLPADVAARCELWSRIAKAWPVGFQESFSVNPATDEITFRQDYRWMTIQDDWNTPPLRFAPLSPTLGLAWKTPGFPMRLSAEIQDPEYFTAFGPFVGAYDVDRLDVTMQVLQYTNELERLEVPAQPTPDQARALETIRRSMASKFPDDWRYHYDHGERANFVWNIVADVWYAKGLPFVDEALRRTAAASMRIYLRNDVLVMHSPLHGKIIFHGPGIGSWGSYGDAGKFSTNSLQPIWAYAHYTGDWDLLRERWDLIHRFFITPEEANWVMFGRGGIAELGDEAPPCSAYARIAWHLGDEDQYLLGAYMFARELVHHYVKQTGGRYFYEHQPYNEFAPMPPRVYPTDIWGSTLGWQVDGPIYGREYSPEHQSANRWVRFHDPDTGRFYREHLADAVREELDWYTQAGREDLAGLYRPDTYKNWLTADSPHTVTSLARLRSFLLGERFEALDAAAPMEAMAGGGGIAAGYAYLRSMVPVAHDRLVPRDVPASPFVLGLQRRGLGDLTSTAQTMGTGLQMQPRWGHWDMPAAPAGDRSRTFGTIAGDFANRVAGASGSQWISYGCRVSWVDAIPPRNVPNADAVLRQQETTPVMLIGPFSNANDLEITEAAYPPEQSFDPAGRYDGAFGPVTWQPAALGRGRAVDLKKALFTEGQSAFGKLAYVQQYVWAPRPMEVYLLVGHCGGAQAWINDDRVISVHTEHGPLENDRTAAVCRLNAGWNRVLIKTESLDGDAFGAQFRLAGLDRLPIPELRFAATPPRP